MISKSTLVFSVGCLALLGGCAASGSAAPDSGGSTDVGSGSGGAMVFGSGGTTPAPGSGGATAPGSGGAAPPTDGGGPMGSGGTTVSDGGGGGGVASCTFMNVMGMVSPKIATVGIVTFATDLTGVTKAQLDFGLDTKYGMTAPVDLTAMSYRTLLLGMKPSKMYHYRISATGPAGTCVSGDYTIMTGAKGGGQSVTVTPAMAPTAFGGFLIFGNYSGSGATIVDADGDTVWWYSGGGDVSGARMSWDGKYMWTLRDNCCTDGGANVHRISMDGLTDENLSSKFSGANHTLCILPDESVVFFSYGNGCDDLKEYAPKTGAVRTIVNTGKANGATGCHTNNVQYSPKDDSLIFSDLNSSSVTKVKRSTGETVWILNGARSAFGTQWGGEQHGISIIDVDRLIIFNNPSTAIELMLDVAGKKATKLWSYRAPSGTSIMGDVQRLPNGNTMVMPSTSGSGVEVAPDGTVVQSLRMSGGSYGFIEKRASLYGPPIKVIGAVQPAAP